MAVLAIQRQVDSLLALLVVEPGSSARPLASLAVEGRDRTMIELSAEHGHLVTTNTYDEVNDLNLVASMTVAAPGWQLNGHRADCRCGSCRPDLAAFWLNKPDSDHG